MKVLEKRYPDIADRVRKVKHELFELVMSEDGKHFNIHSQEGNFYYYDHKDPIGGIRKEFDELSLKNVKIGVFLGFGLGYELMDYMNTFQEKQQSQFFFIFEKNVLFFKFALMVNDLTQAIQNSRVYFFVGEDEGDLLSI
jgi:hypothetical protein